MSISGWEQGHRSRGGHFGICYAHIISVDKDKRTCTIRTRSSNPAYGDRLFSDCQWLNLSTHPQGDEFSIVPYVGSMALCFIVDGTPYIWGFIKPATSTGSLLNGNEQADATEGDYILSTSGGNRLTVKSSGIIELHSGEGLKRVLTPDGQSIYDICSNFHKKTAGGTVDWEVDDATDETVHKAEYRSSLLPGTPTINEQHGAVDSSTIYKKVMGMNVPGVGIPSPLYSKTIGVDGALTIRVGPLGLGCLVTVDPTKGGEVYVKTLSGDVTVETNGGNISAKTSLGNVRVEASAGSIELNGSQGKLKLSGGKVGIGSPSTELLDLFDQTLTKIDALITAIQAQTHPTAVGPSGPPINAADFTKAQADFKQIAGLLSAIKGGV